MNIKLVIYVGISSVSNMSHIRWRGECWTLYKREDS